MSTACVASRVHGGTNKENLALQVGDLYTCSSSKEGVHAREKWHGCRAHRNATAKNLALQVVS